MPAPPIESDNLYCTDMTGYIQRVNVCATGSNNQYLPGKKNFVCPSTSDSRVMASSDWKDVSYGMNIRMMTGSNIGRRSYTRWSKILRPSKTVLIGDRTNQYDFAMRHFAAGGSNYMYGFLMDIWQTGLTPYFRHSGTAKNANFIFGDGHGHTLHFNEYDDKFGTGWGDWTYWGYGTQCVIMPVP